MNKTRVLVVDDSVTMRRLVRQALEQDPELQVAGVAANGRIALAMIAQVSPDVVTLDIEMPEMDGLETLREVRRQWPKLPVIMFSTLTERGAAATMDALTLGANDYVTKPAGAGSMETACERVRIQLTPKIKALHGRRNVTVPTAAATPRTFVARPVYRERARVDVLAIGASTGGPNALSELLPQLPTDLPVPVVIVQHMPPVFTRFLAERLSAGSRLRVREGVAGAELSNGDAWVAPGDFHMETFRDGATTRLLLHQAPPENSCRPSVDVLFRSVAQVYGDRVLGVVLTGMGQDGLIGAGHIREAGGQVIVQDEASSVVWGMPGFIARAGLADAVLPLSQIAGEIALRVAYKRSALRAQVGA